MWYFFVAYCTLPSFRGTITIQTYRKGDDKMNSSNKPETFGDRLRKLRSENNFNQASFGELLGELMGIKRVSSSAIGAYERNEREPTYEMLRTIANYFNVSLDYLLCNSDEKLRVEDFIKQDRYELSDLLTKYSITLSGEELSPAQVKRILDISTTILLGTES